MDSLRSMHPIDFAITSTNKTARLFERERERGTIKHFIFLVSLSVFSMVALFRITPKKEEIFFNSIPNVFYKISYFKVERFFPEIPSRTKVILMSQMHAQNKLTKKNY